MSEQIIKQRLTMIEELVIKQGLPYLDVLRVYTKFNSKVYKRSIEDMRRFKVFDGKLEEKAFELTKRYFRMYGERK